MGTPSPSSGAPGSQEKGKAQRHVGRFLQPEPFLMFAEHEARSTRPDVASEVPKHVRIPAKKQYAVDDCERPTNLASNTASSRNGVNTFDASNLQLDDGLSSIFSLSAPGGLGLPKQTQLRKGSRYGKELLKQIGSPKSPHASLDLDSPGAPSAWEPTSTALEATLSALRPGRPGGSLTRSTEKKLLPPIPYHLPDSGAGGASTRVSIISRLDSMAHHCTVTSPAPAPLMSASLTPAASSPSPEPWCLPSSPPPALPSHQHQQHQQHQQQQQQQQPQPQQHHPQSHHLGGGHTLQTGSITIVTASHPPPAASTSNMGPSASNTSTQPVSSTSAAGSTSLGWGLHPQLRAVKLPVFSLRTSQGSADVSFRTDVQGHGGSLSPPPVGAGFGRSEDHEGLQGIHIRMPNPTFVAFGQPAGLTGGLTGGVMGPGGEPLPEASNAALSGAAATTTPNTTTTVNNMTSAAPNNGSASNVASPTNAAHTHVAAAHPAVPTSAVSGFPASPPPKIVTNPASSGRASPAGTPALKGFGPGAHLAVPERETPADEQMGPTSPLASSARPLDVLDRRRHAAVQEASSGTWYLTIFPSNRPSSRRDCQFLEQWLELRLSADMFDAGGAWDGSLFPRIQQLFATCLSELCRQVAVHCFERGQLLARVWNYWTELVDVEYFRQRGVMAELDRRLATMGASVTAMNALLTDQAKLNATVLDLDAAASLLKKRCETLEHDKRAFLDEIYSMQVGS
eukprot:jgi/Mesvir1/22366/Mv25107-RA.1